MEKSMTTTTFDLNGYQVARQKGSHIRLIHHDPKRNPLTIPDHKTIGKGLLRKLLRDAERSVSDFLKLLQR